jgi:hypothetical protein
MMGYVMIVWVWGVRYDVLGYWSDQCLMMRGGERSVTRESDLSKGKVIFVLVWVLP